MRIAFTVFLIIFLLPIKANGKDSILWQTYHSPPGIIKIGDNKEQGFVQRVLKLIINRLPEYKHEMPMTTLARALSDMKAGQFACHPALFKTKEREKYMYFSQASMISPTNRIVAHRGKLDNIVKNSSVDLIELLQYPGLTVALVKGRSFTEDIDTILSEYLNKEYLFEMTSTDLSSLFQMIELGRVDLTIAYPFELDYYIQHSPKAVDSIQIYPINDMELYTLGSIACPKNEWGKRVISKVNTILDEIKSTEEYKQAVTTWWESERGRAEFELFYHNEFLTHK